MKNGILIGIAALLGVSTGAAAGYLYAKKKYAGYVSPEEYEEMRSVYRKKAEGYEEVEPEVVKAPEEKPSIMEYRKIASKYAGAESPEEDNGDTPETRVISPKEFGEDESYEIVTLTYTEDGYLLDEDDEPVEEPESYIGMDSSEIPTHFGEYEEDDSVFVQNDDAQTYYEILISEKRYKDMIPSEE